MRNLVLCLDGTWNRADALHPTNVVLTMRAAARCALSGRPPRSVFHRGQVIYYDAGVGTGRWDRVRGGAFGMGLGDNVKQAYRWLCQNWRPNDRIFVFGYSRGAYTARSLAGLIGRCGIQEPRNAQAAIDAHCGNDTEAAVRLSNEARTIYVDFLGVWDTVGSLGVPIDGLRWMGAWRHRWHDVSIGEHVRRACHLVAIDEARGPFQPALWTGPVAPNQVVEQVWFPGVHGDVGGGRPDPNLSGRALLFMWDRAESAGLELDRAVAPEVASIRQCRPGNSLVGPYRFLKKHRRLLNTGATNEAIHESAVQLVAESPEYRRGPSAAGIIEALDGGLSVVHA